MSHDFYNKAHGIAAPYSPAPSHLSQATMADQSTQQSRPPSNSYPSPHSYPSPSMQPTYTYPPPQQQQHGQPNAEPYRASPQGSTLPPLNLPPIQSMDRQAQPAPPPMGSPLPPQHGLPHQYYPHGHPPPPGPPMPMGGGPHFPTRYQLPPQNDQRILSGGRHKKEIKRRTKTGCLTCRKRRIKCDEGHPTCRNCQKSKRECLGYDPIFKQQPGPPQIQPAPNSTPHPPPSAPTSTPPTQVPQGYAPAASAAYAPPMPAAAPSHRPHDSFTNPAIDPALAAADPALLGAPQSYNGTHPAMGAANPYAAVPDPPVIKAKRVQVTDLFAIGNQAPPDVPQRVAPITPDLDDEFVKIYSNDYCSGLDAILETKWFTANNNALGRIWGERALHEEAAHFTETVRYRTSSADMAGIFGQEARLIWHMLSVCKQPAPTTNGTNGTMSANAENENTVLNEVRARFDILEALLTNHTLQSNPLHRISYASDNTDDKRREMIFWEELGNFVVHADMEPGPGGLADQALGKMRNVLSSIEVRDALYSVAIARHLGNRIRGFPSNIPPDTTQNPESDLNKLSVAMGFISYECRNGTQQVISRICDMAMLSWAVSRSP